LHLTSDLNLTKSLIWQKNLTPQLFVRRRAEGRIVVRQWCHMTRKMRRQSRCKAQLGFSRSWHSLVNVYLVTGHFLVQTALPKSASKNDSRDQFLRDGWNLQPPLKIHLSLEATKSRASRNRFPHTIGSKAVSKNQFLEVTSSRARAERRRAGRGLPP
jgi:hypothetical protein